MAANERSKPKEIGFHLIYSLDGWVESVLNFDVWLQYHNTCIALSLILLESEVRGDDPPLDDSVWDFGRFSLAGRVPARRQPARRRPRLTAEAARTGRPREPRERWLPGAATRLRLGWKS